MPSSVSSSPRCLSIGSATSTCCPTACSSVAPLSHGGWCGEDCISVARSCCCNGWLWTVRRSSGRRPTRSSPSGSPDGWLLGASESRLELLVVPPPLLNAVRDHPEVTRFLARGGTLGEREGRARATGKQPHRSGRLILGASACRAPVRRAAGRAGLAQRRVGVQRSQRGLRACTAVGRRAQPFKRRDRGRRGGRSPGRDLQPPDHAAASRRCRLQPGPGADGFVPRAGSAPGCRTLGLAPETARHARP